MKINLADGTINTPNFSLSKTGILTASNGIFSGDINGSSIIGGSIYVTKADAP